MSWSRISRSWKSKISKRKSAKFDTLVRFCKATLPASQPALWDQAQETFKDSIDILDQWSWDKLSCTPRCLLPRWQKGTPMDESLDRMYFSRSHRNFPDEGVWPICLHLKWRWTLKQLVLFQDWAAGHNFVHHAILHCKLVVVNSHQVCEC